MDELARARASTTSLVFGGGIVPDADIPTLEGGRRRRHLHAGRLDGVDHRWLEPRSTRGSASRPDHATSDRSTHRPGRMSPWICSSTKASSSSPRYGIPVSPGEAVDHGRRRGRRRRPHRLPGGGQGAGAGRRPGQGRRHQAGRRRRRGAASTPRTSSAWTSRATSSRSSGSRRRATSPRSTTRQLHARPGGQEAPRHAVGAGRRRDRDGRRGEPRRHRQDLRSTRSTGSTEARAREWVDGRQAQPRRPPTARSTSCSSSTRAYTEGDADLVEINPLILTPDGRGARARRQGHPRRQRRVPSPRLRASTTPPRCATTREQAAHEQGPAVRRPRRLRRHHRQRRRARDEHGRHRQPGRRRSRPTSSTSAAAPTPT